MNTQLFKIFSLSFDEKRRIFNVNIPSGAPSVANESPAETSDRDRLTLQRKMQLAQSTKFDQPNTLNQDLLQKFADNAGADIANVKEWIKGSASLQNQYITFMARGASVVQSHERPIEVGTDVKTNIIPKHLTSNDQIGKAILFIENDNPKAYKENSRIIVQNLDGLLKYASNARDEEKNAIKKIINEAGSIDFDTQNPPYQFVRDLQNLVQASYRRDKTATYRKIGFPIDGKIGPRTLNAIRNYLKEKMKPGEGSMDAAARQAQNMNLKKKNKEEIKPDEGSMDAAARKAQNMDLDKIKRDELLKNLKPGTEVDTGGEFEAKVYKELKELTTDKIKNVTELNPTIKIADNEAKINISGTDVSIPKGYKFFILPGSHSGLGVFLLYEGKAYGHNGEEENYTLFNENELYILDKDEKIIAKPTSS